MQDDDTPEHSAVLYSPRIPFSIQIRPVPYYFYLSTILIHNYISK